MLGSLKKLELSDGAAAVARDINRPDRAENSTRRVFDRTEKQMFAVPTDGWVGGPGRWFYREK